MTKRAWLGSVLLALLLEIGHVWAEYPELSPSLQELREKILLTTEATPEDEEQAQEPVREGWVRLRGDVFEGRSYRVSYEAALALLSRDLEGKLLPTPPGQNHPVTARGGVHFKANEGPVPLNPGMERAIGAFQELVFGNLRNQALPVSRPPPGLSARAAGKRPMDEGPAPPAEGAEARSSNPFISGMAPSALLSLEGVSLFDAVANRRVQTTAPLQASLTVKGKSFKEHLHQAIQGTVSLDQITPSSFSALMLGGLLTHPADNKPGNFILSARVDGRFDLVAIDNDMAFANPISFALTAGPSPKTLHKVDVKNILYCLTPLMDLRVDEHVRDSLISQPPEVLVLKWLAALEAKNQVAATLGLSEDDRTNLSLPLYLPPRFVPKLIVDLRKLQAILRDQPHVTHHEVFQLMQPLMCAYYQKILQDYERMGEKAALVKKLKKKDLEGTLESYFTLHQQDFQPYILSFEAFTRMLEDREGGFNFYGAYHRIHNHNYRVPLEEILDLPQKVKLWGESDAPLYQLLRRETTPEEDPERDRIETVAEAAQKLVSSMDFCALDTTHQEEILVTLAQQFSDLPAPDSWKGKCVLYPLIQNLEPQVSKILLPLLQKWGVNLNEGLTAHRGTLLHNALLETDLSQDDARLRLQQNIQVYLASGIALDVTDGDGDTALDIALQQGLRAVPVVTQLLHAGAGQKLKMENLVAFYRALQDTGALEGEIQEALHDLEEGNPKVKWSLTYERILPARAGNPEDIKIGSALYGIRYLPQSLQSHLWNPEGRFRKANHYGRCEVGRVSLDERHSLYFKKRPELGGLGYAASRLLQELCGHGAPFMDLVWIRGEPFLVSQGVEGDTLQDVLNDPSKLPRLAQLHPERTAEFSLMTLLLCPEDGKPDNYILYPRQDWTYELVGIDDEHAFAPPFTSTLQEGSLKVYPHMKSVIFCLDQMGGFIPQAVKDHFKQLDPAVFLGTWLQELEHVHTQFMNLFREEHTEDLLNHGSLIGIMFTEGMMARLYDRMINLQHILSEENPALTLFDVMKRLEPELVKRYSSRGRGEAFDPSLSIQKRFKQAEGKYYKVGHAGECLSSTSASAYLRAHGIPVHADTLKAIKRGDMGPARARLELDRMIETVTVRELGVESLDALRAQLAQLTTEHQRTAFLRQLNLGQMDGPQQRAWLEVLQSLPCRHLNFAGCTVFTEAYLRNRPDFQNLISLEAPNCPELADTLFEMLAQNCFALEHLNLSGNPKLKKIAEKRAFGDRPLTFQYLRHLQLNECPNLDTIHLVTPNLRVCELNRSPQLKTLYLKAPPLKRMELRNHTTLTDSLLFQWVPQWPNLEEISLERCELIEGRKFFELTPQFFAHDWAPEARTRILHAWRDKSSNLYLAGQQIGGRGAEVLIPMLEQNRTLTLVELASNEIGNREAEALAHMFEHNATITKLLLGDNQIGEGGAEALAHMLEHNRTLTYLGLEGNQIGARGADAFAYMLEQNRTLTDLELGNNQIGDSGAEALGRGLERNTNLKGLLLWRNQIGNRGAEALARMLEQNWTLKDLHMWNNQIGDGGAEALAHMLEQNRTLTDLNLGRNQISDSGVRALAWGLEQNTTLTYLDLKENQISAPSLALVEAILTRNQDLRNLELALSVHLGNIPRALETEAAVPPPESRPVLVEESEELTRAPLDSLPEEGPSLYRPSFGDHSEHTAAAFTLGRSASPLVLAKFFHRLGLSHKPLHQLADVIFANGPSVSYTCAALASEDGQTPYFSAERVRHMFERQDPLMLGSLQFSDTLTTLCVPYKTCPPLGEVPHRSIFSTRTAQKNACVDFKIEDLVRLYSHPERATELHPAPLNGLGRYQEAFEAITYQLQPDLEANLPALAMLELEQYTPLPSRRMLFSIDNHTEEIASTRLNPHNHCTLTPRDLRDADEDTIDRLLEGHAAFFRRLSERAEETDGMVGLKGHV